MSWVADNVVSIVGWLAASLVTVFVVGRRFQALEDADKNLAGVVSRLAETVRELSAAVHGDRGNVVLAKSIDRLAEAVQSITARTAANEAVIRAHEAKIARGEDAMRVVNDRLSAVSAQLAGVVATQHEHGTMLARIEERIASFMRGGRSAG
jgi:type II secretory pathway pseudopilin PulG